MTGSYSEPTDVGPAAGGHVEATDDQRRAAAEVVARAVQSGYLSPEQGEQRLLAVRQARIVDDLTVIVRDLAGAPAFPGAPTLPPAPARGPVSAWFGKNQILGLWTVPAELPVTAVLGDVVVDLQTAHWLARDIVLDVTAVMGNIKVLVPQGVAVRVDVTPVLGSVTLKRIQPPQFGTPSVTLRGTVVLGGVEVVGPRTPNGFTAAFDWLEGSLSRIFQDTRKPKDEGKA